MINAQRIYQMDGQLNNIRRVAMAMPVGVISNQLMTIHTRLVAVAEAWEAANPRKAK